MVKNHSFNDRFASLHPVVTFCYFIAVIGCTMFFMHPILLVASLSGAVAYAFRLKGGKAVGRMLAFLIPSALLAAAVNPAFNHEGATILAYLPSGNPLTRESILYGCGSAVLLASVIFWFVCYSAVMTSDKFIYLFGRVIPALSLVLSMTLRFVPRFTAQMRAISDARRTVRQNGRIAALREAVKVLSATVTWSLENAVETADSMKARGWGLPKRSAFSLFRFGERDRYALAWILCCGMYVLFGSLSGGLAVRYYPTFRMTASGAFPISFMLAYLALAWTPVVYGHQWCSILSRGADSNLRN